MSLVAQEKSTPSGTVLSGPGESRALPNWFVDEQQAAWDEFDRLPAPSRNDQPWRFSNVSLLDLSPFKRSEPISDNLRNQILERSRALDEVSGRLVFAGDALILRDVVSEKLRQRGVIFQPLERAMTEHTE